MPTATADPSAALTRSRTRVLDDALTEARRRLRRLAAPVIDAPAGGNSGSNADGDVAQEHERAEESARTRGRLLVEIRALEAALERVENGTYGLCSECGEPIPEKRLLARPTAELCVRDQAEQERRADGALRRRGYFPIREDVAPVDLVDGDEPIAAPVDFDTDPEPAALVELPGVRGKGRRG